MKQNDYDMIEMHIVDYTNNGVCSCCGQCCTNFLPMDYQEIDRIRRYIKKHNITATTTAAPYTSHISAMFHCPFRDDVNRRCTIYPVRPRICKSFQCNKEKPVLLEERTKAHLRSGGTEVDLRASFFDEIPAFAELFAHKIA